MAIAFRCCCLSLLLPSIAIAFYWYCLPLVLGFVLKLAGPISGSKCCRFSFDLLAIAIEGQIRNTHRSGATPPLPVRLRSPLCFSFQITFSRKLVGSHPQAEIMFSIGSKVPRLKTYTIQGPGCHGPITTRLDGKERRSRSHEDFKIHVSTVGLEDSG